MASVDHPNLIRLYETYEDELYLHLVIELCNGGDICERIIERGSFNEAQAKIIMKQLLSAVNYMHLNNITHRDLKAENFLYVDKDSNDVKICDFGMSIRNYRNKMKSIAGTPYYLAPEVFKGPYTKACDVWSLGVFMYFIITGKHPFKGSNLESIYEKSSKGIINLDFSQLSSISLEGQDFLKKLLEIKPNKRLTCKQSLEHQWFQSTEVSNSIPESVFKSLLKYKAKNKLWQEAVKIVVKNLSNNQINSLRQAFITLDSSNSGFITAQDLQESMKTHGFNLALEETEGIIQNCSYIQSGKINYSEFLVATLNKKALMNEEIMWEAFKLFDKKKQGKINVQDLDAALKQAGCEFTGEEFQELIAEAKLDNNSDIDYSNFKVIMNCFEEEEENINQNRRVSLMRRMSRDIRGALDFGKLIVKD
jgi:calcium-dependent protein kinase